jgi:uncharacterized protein
MVAGAAAPASATTYVDNEPFFHVHVALGGRDGSARGGHLFEMTARPTVELVLNTYAGAVRRKIDRESGLPLLDT